MAVIGAAMKVARQPETGRHYPSDRCPVASDGREQGKEEGKRGASLALGVRCNSQELVRHFWRELPVKLIQQLDASGYDSARASRQGPVPRVPHPPDPRQIILKARMEIPAMECRCESCMMQ